jgi:hypothetical protein
MVDHLRDAVDQPFETKRKHCPAVRPGPLPDARGLEARAGLERIFLSSAVTFSARAEVIKGAITKSALLREFFGALM